MSPTKFNALTPFVRGAWYALFVAGATGGIYATTINNIELLQIQVADNVKSDKQITATVNTIRTEQAVIKTTIEQSAKNSAEFRTRVNKALDRILDKLDK